MRIYNSDQADKLFLSPYTIVNYTENKLCIYSTLFDDSITVYCNIQQAEQILEFLKQGVTEEFMLRILQSELPDVYEPYILCDWMRKGILE